MNILRTIKGICPVIILTALLLTGCKRFSTKADYTFVVVGDNRVAPADTLNDASTANTYQLNRMFAEIAALNPRPKYFFFLGDLVLGYTNGDTIRLVRELREWKKLYLSSPLAKTDIKLIVVPGNHELCEKIGSGRVSIKAYERIFVSEMKQFIAGDNGPKATGLIPATDSLMTDQSCLTYSFDYGGDHFVICNTDPVDRESRLPYHWLEHDLGSAHKQGARHIFLFGHKPAFSPPPAHDGLDVYTSNRDSAWAAMTRNKCDVYFASHYHLWDSLHPMNEKSTWQITSGNAGAPIAKSWPSPYFGFTIVNVNSEVEITSMGRDADREHQTAPAPDKSTTARAHFTIK
ncbi:MAG: hypothetical protein HKL88_07100 [Bacteroidia bacterium]|nr:hypothetical protein [Bacteroidia bacterium]